MKKQLNGNFLFNFYFKFFFISFDKALLIDLNDKYAWLSKGKAFHSLRKYKKI